jgi:hypothetical protein
MKTRWLERVKDHTAFNSLFLFNDFPPYPRPLILGISTTRTLHSKLLMGAPYLVP